VTWWKDCEGQMMDGNREKVRGWGKESPCFKSLKIVIWLRLRDADCTAAIVAHIPMCRSITNVRSETYHHPFSRPVLVILVFRVSSFDSFLLPSSFSGASLNLSSYNFFFFLYHEYISLRDLWLSIYILSRTRINSRLIYPDLCSIKVKPGGNFHLDDINGSRRNIGLTYILESETALFGNPSQHIQKLISFSEYRWH
jgi:hypothetical protein